ncbi:MAG: SAM-dependent methyltransferase [Flammeovirgaceae bacterium]|nr:SAM-dependent methyltransferase [Flammeovirgaceae bacterium]
MSKGVLYLIPTTIADGNAPEVLPPQIQNHLTEVDFFMVENIRTTRRFLSSLKIFKSIEYLELKELNKDTPDSEIQSFIKEILIGKTGAILSESGCPGIADPGSRAVLLAHKSDIKVIPLVGPSSIVLALMASGLNGQQFAFHGYLPINSNECAKKIIELEKESALKNQTQLFIETPYRNERIFLQLLKNLKTTTLLSIACDLTGPSEQIHTQSVAQWKAKKPVLEKSPMVFSFLAQT